MSAPKDSIRRRTVDAPVPVDALLFGGTLRVLTPHRVVETAYLNSRWLRTMALAIESTCPLQHHPTLTVH
ncbi:hypothetical protein MESS4_60104 [Mesorhizobium sp. STM 4661]|nr:hypothetical protein MESS4_60104 [Mesorhizobium sp. STM 4661]